MIVVLGRGQFPPVTELFPWFPLCSNTDQYLLIYGRISLWMTTGTACRIAGGLLLKGLHWRRHVTFCFQFLKCLDKRRCPKGEMTVHDLSYKMFPSLDMSCGIVCIVTGYLVKQP